MSVFLRPQRQDAIPPAARLEMTLRYAHCIRRLETRDPRKDRAHDYDHVILEVYHEGRLLIDMYPTENKERYGVTENVDEFLVSTGYLASGRHTDECWGLVGHEFLLEMLDSPAQILSCGLYYGSLKADLTAIPKILTTRGLRMMMYQLNLTEKSILRWDYKKSKAVSQGSKTGKAWAATIGNFWR